MIGSQCYAWSFTPRPQNIDHCNMESIVSVGNIFFTLYFIGIIKIRSNLHLGNYLKNYWKTSPSGKCQNYNIGLCSTHSTGHQ